MKKYQWLMRNAVVAVIVCLMIGITTLAQQSTSSSSSQDTSSQDTSSQDTSSDEAQQDRSSTTQSDRPTTTPSDRRSTTQPNRRSTTQPGSRSTTQEDGTSDDRFEGRRDRQENRFNQRDDRLDQRDDRFDQRDGRFDRRGDRSDQRDDRFSTERDRSDRRVDSQQQDRAQGRTEAGAGIELGASLETNDQDQLVVSNLSSRGLLVDSGIRQGDVIISVDNRPLRSQTEFIRTVRTYDGPRVPVVVLRDGRRQTIFVTVDQSRRTAEFRGYAPDDYRSHQFDSDRAWLGVYLDTRYQDHAVVEAVEIGSAADRAGLRGGDWILGVNNQRIQGPSHLSRMIRGMEPGQEVRLDVSRRVTRDIAARLGELPSSHGRFRYDEGMETGRDTTTRDITTRESYEQRTYRGEFDAETSDERDRQSR